MSLSEVAANPGLAKDSKGSTPGNSTIIDPVLRLKQEGRVLVIDDEPAVGALAVAICEGSVKSAKFFPVSDVKGVTDAEKMAWFKEELSKFLGLDSLPQTEWPNVIILDRDLKMGGLKLPDGIPMDSEAAKLDKNDGPSLVPLLKQMFPGVKIMAYTGQSEVPGIAEIYGGVLVASKPLKGGIDELITLLQNTFTPPAVAQEFDGRATVVAAMNNAPAT